jgi:CBS domain-containing protein
MQNSQVKEVMKEEPVMISPDATLEEAARKMKENECGVLPVGTEDKIQGIITDRDIVIRAISEGKSPATERVRNYMTPEVCSCEESDTIMEAAEKMHDNNVSRLVVKDAEGKACGILTFGSILRKKDDQAEVSDIVACATGKKAA